MLNFVEGCKSVTPNAPSVTLELLAKCAVHFPLVVKNEHTGAHLSTSRLFVQVGDICNQ